MRITDRQHLTGPGILSVRNMRRKADPYREPGPDGVRVAGVEGSVVAVELRTGLTMCEARLDAPTGRQLAALILAQAGEAEHPAEAALRAILKEIGPAARKWHPEDGPSGTLERVAHAALVGLGEL